LAALLRPLKSRWPDTAIIVKLPPYFNDVERENRLALVELAVELGMTGVVIPGNWRVDDARLSKGQGSIAGKATFSRTLSVVRDIAAVARGRIAIKATGGVSTGHDAMQMLAAGATLVDILSAFVYRGWAAAALIN